MTQKAPPCCGRYPLILAEVLVALEEVHVLAPVAPHLPRGRPLSIPFCFQARRGQLEKVSRCNALSRRPLQLSALRVHLVPTAPHAQQPFRISGFGLGSWPTNQPSKQSSNQPTKRTNTQTTYQPTDQVAPLSRVRTETHRQQRRVPLIRTITPAATSRTPANARSGTQAEGM